MIGEITCLALALASYIGFTVYAVKQFGVLKYVSSTYYELEKMKLGTGIYFTVWCAMMAVFTLPCLLYITEGWMDLVAVLCAVGLLFVGAAPRFLKHTAWHNAGAITTAIAAIVIILSEGYEWELLIALVIFAMPPIFSGKNIAFWGEHLLFAVMFYVLPNELIFK